MLRVTLLLLATLIPFSAQAEPLRVVASFSIIADITREIGGDAIAVTSLVQPNSDAHMYEPTPTDVKTVAKAQLIIVNGLGFEGWLKRLINASGYKGALVEAAHGVKPLHMEEEGEHHDHHHEAADPHAWHDVANAKQYTKNIRDALIKADPAHSAQYQANAQTYLNKLDELDSWAHRSIQSVPISKRKIITSHDAFGYLAHAYNISISSPQGLSTDSQPSAKQVAQLIDQIRREKITAIFIENLSESRLIQQITADTGAVIRGTLYSDALSDSKGPATTYLTMFRHNMALLIEAMRNNPEV
ncbi:MAG: metal ABC transporter substrate-binding protein [Rickettsiales bacterium]|nr:metal ABC transporter substrate-binding protein [Rickettsiales bacterium]